jgi:hypothetical protein
VRKCAKQFDDGLTWPDGDFQRRKSIVTALAVAFSPLALLSAGQSGQSLPWWVIVVAVVVIIGIAVAMFTRRKR